MSRRASIAGITRGAPLAGALLLLGALTWPLLLTPSGFNGDWEHHLWLLWHQSISLQSRHFPSLYLNSSYSVFYPTYGFYGGTLFALGGMISLLLGGAPVQAYVFVYVLDFACAFAGWYWLGRMAGLGRWLAMVPGLVFITSAYYIVVIYVQGDWPEFTGISMIPLLVAALLSVLRADRLRAGSAFALALSGVLFLGAHDLTILMGVTTLTIVAAVVVACIPDVRQQLTRKGVVRVASLLVPAALVNAWYLLPALVYSSRTRLGSEYHEARAEMRAAVSLVSDAHLFALPEPGLPGVLPVLAIAWVLMGLFVLPWGARSRLWRRLLSICIGIAVLILVAMTHVGLLLALPRPYTLIQYSYRLEAYIVLALCGAILAALVLACSPRAGGGRPWRARAWTWLALPVCVGSLAGAVRQVGVLEYPGPNRYEPLQSFGVVYSGDNRDYQDVSEPVIAGHGLEEIDIPPTTVSDDRATFTIRARPGTLVATNIGAGSYLVHLGGAKAVGTDSETGNMVIRTDASGAGAASGSPPVDKVTVSTGESAPVVLGRLLTLVGLACLAVELPALSVRDLLAARRARWVRASGTLRPAAPRPS
jgi:hypothetical protein